MRQIGFVNNIARRGWKQIITVVLNYDELKEKPVLGAFLFVKDGQRNLLARVESAYYAPVLVGDYNQPLAMGVMNKRETDEPTVRSVNFMHYDLTLLGEMDLATNGFVAGIRNVPSLMDAEVFAPDGAELQDIVAAKIPSDTEGSKPFRIGRLQYGASDAYTPPDVEISFDASNLWPKRTAVFGKTGYGKSNLIKTLIAVMNTHDDTMGQLVFDVNGEYGFEDVGTGAGLLDVFGESGDADRLVIYTNRKVKDEYAGFVKPIKFNAYDEPQLSVQLRQARIEQEGRAVPQYIQYYAETDEEQLQSYYWETWWHGCATLNLELPHEDTSGDGSDVPSRYSVEPNKTWREENPGYVDGDGRLYGMENVIEYLRWRNESQDGKPARDEGAKVRSDMRKYFGQFRFLSRLHTPDQGVNVFDAVKEDVEAGKVVIVDLSSVDPAVMDILSGKIAANLFYAAQDKFLEVEAERIRTLIFVEEAHNLLSKERATIFKRVAREGRKYGIGLVYSTQRPGSIEEDILAMTENFFVMHVSSEGDAGELKRAKIAFDSPITEFILSEPAVGVAFVYSEPYQPYVLSCKVDKFEDVIETLKLVRNERQLTPGFASSG